MRIVCFESRKPVEFSIWGLQRTLANSENFAYILRPNNHTAQKNIPMTVAELAQNINVLPEKLFSFFEHIQQPIPHKLDFELSEELIKSATENKFSFEAKNATTAEVAAEEVIQESTDRELKKLLAQDSHKMIEQIKKVNNLKYLVLSGKLTKSAGTGIFGFFEDILDADGNNVFYPSHNENKDKLKIDKIFISNISDLQEGARYFFECELSKEGERRKQRNPYLLQTTAKKVRNAKNINEIESALKDKQTSLSDLNQKIDSANDLIASHNKTLAEKINEVQIKETNLSFLNEATETVKNNMLEMENLIRVLKDRVLLCRNLQFISKDEESRYLNILSPKEFKSDDHLDFEKDFESNFSTLADHIHAYLYLKKNLIYTRYQIRNFLTLLKTHDIIVLSGLSGSGKTQIIKAFAEAVGGIAKIIPVKPNWTSSDDLIGYYNPLQMSFLPTPFTEAIVEAIHNPNQLYFICLDEMNLARVEYYFADFLSKLEERSKQPEIELYATHEEELFVSEFSTLLNLIESSIKGKEIKSWQEFLNDEEARKRFYEMLGNTDKESILQLHTKMRRRLIDILKFPSTIKIPDNIRFIGAINVDETTHYFSPKILDRIHVVKFENPLLFEEQVNNWFEHIETEKELKPVYVKPNLFSERKEFPAVNNAELSAIAKKLKEINKNFLLPLNIDFGVRSLRQALNYAELNRSTYDYGDAFDISLNTVILQKILPRFIFDGGDGARNGKSKMEVLEDFQKFLADEFSEFYFNYESDETGIGKASNEYLGNMIEQAKRNNSQFNFFA